MKNGCLIIMLVVTGVILTNCTDSKNKELIIGKWTGIEWLVNGQPADYTPANASFTFEAGGHYTFQYGESVEKGDYFISGDQLFTTPEGGLKMMVKVPRLSQDTMVFDMNRGGQSERLTLTREK
jgi:hypothetical protein